MATSPDHPELQFIQASGYTKGRADGPPLWIVVHDMEANETATTAEATANYFATGAGGRSVSSHYTADNDSVVQCVLLRDVAWTVGNRPGNYRGINWELAGFAAQTREQWLDPFGKAMFAKMAPIVRADAAKYGIPLQRRSVAELKAFKPGITSHNDLGVAFGGTDHTDPGPNFPWDYFLAVMNGTDGGDDDMAIAHMWKDTAGQYWYVTGPLAMRQKVNAWQVETIRYYATQHTPGFTLVDLTATAITPDIVAQLGVDVATFGGTVDLTDEQLTEISDAAKEGAEAGAPTKEELEDAAFQGAQRAEDE